MFGTIQRVTMPLPTPPGHVHCYLLPGDDGWTLVDTGLGLRDAPTLWRDALAAVDGTVARVVVTHFHPDHVGAAADVAELTGAPVLEGELDYAQCAHVWGSARWPDRIAGWFRRHGVPADAAEELVRDGAGYAPLIRFARDPERLREGDEVAGWRVLELPGHADGHVCLLRDGVLVSGDHLLGDVSPAVGLYPDGRPDPLGDYLASLRRTIELAPRLALPGHGEPIEDPVTRARELIEHHHHRLDHAAAALDGRPQTPYELSFSLFGDELASGSRRFAVAETLSHLERLVRDGRAARAGDGGRVTYTSG